MDNEKALENAGMTAGGAPETGTAVTPEPSLKERKYVGKREFIMFGVAACGQGMVYAVMSSYISDFYVNVMQLPLIFVMLLMLLARIWDAINDPMMGMIADKFTTPLGKMKPYVLFTAIPIALLTFFMFYVPEGFNRTELMIYAAFIYVFWGMTYTVSDVPFWTLPNIMTPNAKERANVISFGRTVNGVGTAIPLALFMVLSWIPSLNAEGNLEAEKTKYMILVLVASILGIALFLTSYFTVKERVKLPPKPKRKKGERGALYRIFHCKPLMIVVIMGVLSSGRYMMQAAAIHVARYAFYIGPSLDGLTGEALQTAYSGSIGTVSTLFQVCSAIGMFGSMLVMPFLYKKFNYKQIVVVSCIGGFLASVISTVFGALSIYNDSLQWMVYLLIPFIIVQCIPLGALNVTAYAMIGDSLDYLEWKTGFRDNALGSACQSFVNKLGNALATTFIIIMYMIINLDPSATVSKDAIIRVTDLTKDQRFGMFALVSIVPGVSLILTAIPVFFYDLIGAKKEKILTELSERRAAEGISMEA